MFFDALAPYWFKQPGATPEQLATTEHVLGYSLPTDYCAFMAWSNGGEGELGEEYLDLWPLDEIAQLNEDYRIARYLPNVLAIGSDGGDKCYAFDYRHTPSAPALVKVGFGDLDPTSIRVVGADFRRGIEGLLNFQRDGANSSGTP